MNNQTSTALRIIADGLDQGMSLEELYQKGSNFSVINMPQIPFSINLYDLKLAFDRILSLLVEGDKQ